jgi:hypothetical protein
MASELSIFRSIWTFVVGLAMILGALIGLSDEEFCAQGCGIVTRPIFDWAYSMFGHWGTSTLLLIGGVVCVIGSVAKPQKAAQSQANNDSPKDAI